MVQTGSFSLARRRYRSITESELSADGTEGGSASRCKRITRASLVQSLRSDRSAEIVNRVSMPLPGATSPQCQRLADFKCSGETLAGPSDFFFLQSFHRAPKASGTVPSHIVHTYEEARSCERISVGDGDAINLYMEHPHWTNLSSTGQNFGSHDYSKFAKRRRWFDQAHCGWRLGFSRVRCSINLYASYHESAITQLRVLRKTQLLLE